MADRDAAAADAIDACARGIPTVDVLGVGLHDVSRADLLQRLKRGMVVTPNVDIIMRARRDAEFRKVLQSADFSLCDSRIVQWATHFLGQPVREKISGSDFFPAFCEFHRDNPAIRVFLLGAREGVAARAQAKINQRLGRRIVVDAHSPSFGFEGNDAECLAIVDLVNRSGATVLAVGVGAPKQEKWMMRWRPHMPGVHILMGIGATIDFEAGEVRRAPGWMSRCGLEWLYRLAQEPRRLWRRYLVDDFPFIGLILCQRLGLKLATRSRNSAGT